LRKDTVWTNKPGGYIQTLSPTGYDVLINGTDRYLNFAAVSGSSGYGFRDNAGTMEFKNSGGSWAAFGSGDVVGPASATDNAIVRFDSTTGKLIQDYTSGAPTISDTGAVNIPLTTGNSFVVDTDVLVVDATNNRVGINTASPGNMLSLRSGTGGDDSIPALGVNGGKFGMFNAQAGAALYGLIQGVLGTGNVFMQVQRVDGTATAYNLLLQPTAGRVGIGTISPTAVLHIKAGTATASTAPLKFTSGTLNTTAESGTFEFDGTDFYVTI